MLGFVPQLNLRLRPLSSVLYDLLLEDVLKVIIDVSNIFLTLPNPPLIKGREPDFSCFPPCKGGIKGGNNAIKITANHFSNNLLAND